MFASKLQSSPGPLSQEQVNRISEAVRDLSPGQLQWLSGYLAGAASVDVGLGKEPATATQAVDQPVITILYGSQTGNANGIAEQLHTQLVGAGAVAKLINLADYNPRQLKSETHVALVVSTQGEGDPPDDALAFHDFLFGKKVPKLNKLKFSVLGLGDSSYEFFCETGRQYDERFAELGASRLSDRIDADLDYQNEAKQWLSQWQETATELISDLPAGQVRPKLSVVSADLAESKWSKFNPFTAPVIDSFRITGSNTHKVINHIEISLEDSGLTYQPGDALGVWPLNSARLVDEVIAKAGLIGDEQVNVNETSQSLREALAELKELTLLHPKLIEYVAEKSANESLVSLVAGERSELLEFIHNRQVVELLAMAPVSWQAQELVDQLRGLTPRLYSIASSQSEVEDEVHLTVRLVEDERDGECRFGTASQFLNSSEEDSPVKVFVEPNRNFRLPENGDTAIIMVGAGTGVAPYRGFMQQREVDGDSGDNWLFFGNTNALDEFLYQIEWQKWKKSALLTRIDLAFSRDQAEKIYIQDRMLEQAEDLFAWLEAGAHFYVCGDKDNMAKAVDDALHQVVAQNSNLGGQEAVEYARDYIKELKMSGRYQHDIY